MCDLNRRTFLQIGMGATAAASMYPGAFAQDTTTKGTAKAVIMLYMDGGPSQIDTFDPKPGKSTGGEFKAIDTAVRCVELSLVDSMREELSAIQGSLQAAIKQKAGG